MATFDEDRNELYLTRDEERSLELAELARRETEIEEAIDSDPEALEQAARAVAGELLLLRIIGSSDELPRASVLERVARAAVQAFLARAGL